MDEKQIARINALYKKSKSVGLTEEEKAEQKELRQAYVRSVRENMRSQLENVTVINPDGTVADAGKARKR